MSMTIDGILWDHQHTLEGATCATPSRDGHLLYVVCVCGARLLVTPAQWGTEAALRAQEAEEEAQEARDG
jgi:hypothetical protein